MWQVCVIYNGCVQIHPNYFVQSTLSPLKEDEEDMTRVLLNERWFQEHSEISLNVGNKELSATYK